MPNLFGLNIAGIVAQAFQGQLVAGTLTSYAVGAQNADPTAGKARASSTHQVQGILEEYEDNKIDGTSILRGDRKILLIANLISPFVVPAMDDIITLEGTPYTIVGPVGRDPAAASFVCQGRST